MTTTPGCSGAVMDHDWRDDEVWAARLEADRARAERNQTPSQRLVSATVLERALAAGAQAVALNGARAQNRDQ